MMNRPPGLSRSTARSRAGLQACAAFLGLLLCGAAMAQADASIDQVYLAAREGHLEQAQQLMAPVLRDHPNSAKAHYVEAELLARQGRTAQARDELGTAEKLAPGLPFARAEAVQGLRREIAADVGSSMAIPAGRLERRTAPLEGGHWGIAGALLGGALLAWMLARLGRPQPAPIAAAPAAMPPVSMPGTWPPGAWPPAAASPSTGLGQQVAGGLATGLAVGAGVAVAESIAQRLFSDGSSVAGATTLPLASDALRAGRQEIDPWMGGVDFSIEDPASWDVAGEKPGTGWDT